MLTASLMILKLSLLSWVTITSGLWRVGSCRSLHWLTVAGVRGRGDVHGIEMPLDPHGHVHDLREHGGQELAPSG
jgi:hypothetical protein